jgi:hypothetical protein
MDARHLRWLWFVGIWLLFPWPLFILQEAWVPAVRYLLLGLVAATVAIVEGAAGPVGLLVTLFLGWGIGTSLCSWLLAWAITKLLGQLSSRVAVSLSLVALGTALIWAITFEPYRTPFGRALRGGLLQVLS